MENKKTRTLFSSVIADTLIFGMGAALLWHFSYIWRYGEFYVREPNTAVLTGETILLAAVTVFGLFRVLKDIQDHS